MADNLLNIVNRVLRETCDDEVTTVVSAPTGLIQPYIKNILTYVNEGYKIIYGRAFKNPDSEINIKTVLTVNDNPFSLEGTGIQSIQGVGIKGYKPITIIPFQDFQKTYYFQPNQVISANPNAIPGLPQVASFFGNSLYIWPELDKDYPLEFFARAVFTPLVNDTDIPLVCDNAIANYACYKQFSYDGDPRQQNAYTDYNVTLTSYLDSIADHSSMPPMIMPEDAY